MVLQKSISGTLALILIALLVGCEGKDVIIIPDLPERLSCIGIIDVDDTCNTLIIEKSYQSGFTAGIEDSIYNLSLSIYSENEILFESEHDTAVPQKYEIELPKIEFENSKNYSVEIRCQGSEDILASSSTTLLPPDLRLVSIHSEEIPFKDPFSPFCDYTKKCSVLNLKFTREEADGDYYAIIVKGKEKEGYLQTPFIHYEVRSCNIPQFLSRIPGKSAYLSICSDWGGGTTSLDYYICFLDMSGINEGLATITLAVEVGGRTVYDHTQPVDIRLLSISEDLFSFEKSLRNYNQAKDDPLAEPVYLDGNFMNGNGIFALCRSSSVSTMLLY